MVMNLGRFLSVDAVPGTGVYCSDTGEELVRMLI